MDRSEIPKIAKAVNRWLSYQIFCGREALLSEAYLGHPVAEYLIHRHSGELETEVNHPILNRSAGGRPRQIDYVLKTRNKADIEAAIECKWIADTTYDRQRVVNDLLRLECIRYSKKTVKRFFLVAGLKQNFRHNFMELQNNVGKSRKPFTKTLLRFSLKNPIKIIKIRDCPVYFQKFYKTFEHDYSASIPTSFKTTLKGVGTVDDVSVYIWEVSSSSGPRVCFSPKTRWQK